MMLLSVPNAARMTGNARATANDDASSLGWAVLGFFIPLAGLILYLVWKNEYPLRAKSAGKGALVSVIVSVVLYIIVIAFTTCVVASYGVALGFLASF